MTIQQLTGAFEDRSYIKEYPQPSSIISDESACPALFFFSFLPGVIALPTHHCPFWRKGPTHDISSALSPVEIPPMELLVRCTWIASHGGFPPETELQSFATRIASTSLQGRHASLASQLLYILTLDNCATSCISFSPYVSTFLIHLVCIVRCNDR